MCFQGTVSQTNSPDCARVCARDGESEVELSLLPLHRVECAWFCLGTVFSGKKKKKKPPEKNKIYPFIRQLLNLLCHAKQKQAERKK